MKTTSLLLASTGLCAVMQLAVAEDKSIRFDIPAQSAADALDALAAQSELQMLFDRNALQNSRTQAVSGLYTAREALQKLLVGSGLTFTFTAADAVAIKPGDQQFNQADPATLPAVKVVGQPIYDALDPYNPDYVLPNATAGTKTDTPIMETPLNVQVISKQVLKDQQVINLGQALKNVSGVTTGSFAFGTGNPGTPSQQISLRGFASETIFRNGFRLQGVSGMGNSASGSFSREMANVESVEVLKGPAAILYGLVEPGGMVNVVTKQPLATPYYSLQQQFGSYDLYRTSIDATGPLSKDDTLLYRTNFSYENSGSFRDFVFNDSLFFAPTLRWNISPRTQATLELEYQHKKFGTDVGFIPNVNGHPINIPRSRNYGEYSPGEQDTIFVGLNWSHQFNDDWSIKHRVAANLADSHIPQSTYPAFHFGKPDTVYRLNYFNQASNNDTYSTNLDLTGHFDTVGLKHTLLIGGDYFRIDTQGSYATDLAWSSFDLPNISAIDVNNPVHPGRNPPILDPTSYFKGVNKTDQYGLYIQDQIKLPFNVHVMGGIRYQYIHQTSFTQDYIGTTTQQNPTTQDAVTPRVGILWQAQNWLSLYANYAESFGANTGKTWPNSGSIAPTSAEQYEGGIKTEFFDGRLRATLAYYDLTKTNVASNDPDITHLCGGVRCSIAVGAIRSRGPELDIQGEILPGWNMIATYANTQVNIVKTNSDNAMFFDTLSVGDRYWGVPRNTASFFSTYEFQEDSLKGFKVGGGVNMQDSQLVCCNRPLPSIQGFATIDLLASYSLKVGKTKVTTAFNINNLLNKYYFTGGGIDAPSGMFATFGQPRFFMGSVKVEF
ncbi:TonB-dependent siderophore receptor [Methylomonas albis]|uniref:TonB-dependent receptor n=1 Tax=Methylomonas albis TaxID=1854563 RepID=A0ABR9CY90_9GAMM|nr:TonB-dependent receptor [Methylomonas albis]MBD9355832.1 TonB-dependent receptor [Methylomonas albis]